MKRTGRRTTQDGEDDEWLVREILAERRQRPVAQRQIARAGIDRKRLEVWAERDDERMAFRPVLPASTDPMRNDRSPRAGSEGGLELLESTEPRNLPRETQKALALWTRYRLACLELTGGGRTGGA